MIFFKMKTKHIKIEYSFNEDGNAFYDVHIDGRYIKKICFNFNDNSGNAELRTTIFEENISFEDYFVILGRIMEKLSVAKEKDGSISVTVEEVLPTEHNCSSLTYNFLKTDDKNAILKIILHNECCCLPLKCCWDGRWELADKFSLFEKLQTFTNKIHVKHYVLINGLVKSIDTFNEKKDEFCCYVTEASMLDMCNLR